MADKTGYGDRVEAYLDDVLGQIGSNERVKNRVAGATSMFDAAVTQNPVAKGINSLVNSQYNLPVSPEYVAPSVANQRNIEAKYNALAEFDPLRQSGFSKETLPYDLPNTIKAYRADVTGRFGGKEGLETRPIGQGVEANTFNPRTAYVNSRSLAAAMNMGLVPKMTPEEIATYMLKEGRTDMGANMDVEFGNTLSEFRYPKLSDKENAIARQLMEKLSSVGIPSTPYAVQLPVAIANKHAVAQRLGIPFAHAWHGTGVTKEAESAESYTKGIEQRSKAALHPKNKPLLDIIKRGFADAVKYHTQNDGKTPDTTLPEQYSEGKRKLI